MTKPDDIPQDLRQQARSIYFNRCDEVSRLAAEFEEEEVIDLLVRAIKAERDRLTDPQFLAKHIATVGLVGREAVDEAIMAEREACAQVATDFSDRIGASHFVAVQVAAAIRSRGAA